MLPIVEMPVKAIRNRMMERMIVVPLPAQFKANLGAEI
jgi:hypothetical protein